MKSFRGNYASPCVFMLSLPFRDFLIVRKCIKKDVDGLVTTSMRIEIMFSKRQVEDDDVKVTQTDCHLLHAKFISSSIFALISEITLTSLPTPANKTWTIYLVSNEHFSCFILYDKVEPKHQFRFYLHFSLECFSHIFFCWINTIFLPTKAINFLLRPTAFNHISLSSNLIIVHFSFIVCFRLNFASFRS